MKLKESEIFAEMLVGLSVYGKFEIYKVFKMPCSFTAVNK